MPIKIDEVQKVAEKSYRDTPSLTATGVWDRIKRARKAYGGLERN